LIISKIIGGVGNQLFQYAIGRALAMHHCTVLKLDTSDFDGYKLHNGFRLDNFNIDCDIAKIEEVRNLKGPNNFIASFLRRASNFKRQTYLKEKGSSIFDPNVFNYRCVYLDGYWQNELYFKDLRSVLLQELTPAVPLNRVETDYLLQMRFPGSVSIHVRRGDYLNIKNIGVLDVDYYKNAINYIVDRVKDPRFFIFSDDMNWCKVNFNFLKQPIYVSETRNEIVDLQLMSSCNHNIIANSSFSWWGAWLNQNPNKIVVAPKGWRLDDPGSNNIILQDWVQLC
jgi:hypothetical protein